MFLEKIPPQLKPFLNRQILVQYGLVILVTVIVFTVLNAGFFIKNIRYAATGPLPETPAPTEQISLPNQLHIPSLNINAPIIFGIEKNEATFQKALANGVVHYPGTALPGQIGNAYIFGHSSDYAWSVGDYKTIFALLPRIEIGARIEVTDFVGRSLIFTVTETKVIKKDDLSVLSQNTSGKKILTLQTSYPVGTALQRFIVIAELAE